MGSIELRTKQITLGKWGAGKGEEKLLKGKPTRENSIGRVETKKDLVESFKILLRGKPEVNVEIKVYWPGRRGKFDEVTLSRKRVEGREIFIEGPAAIEQIAMLSAKKGNPESISVNEVHRWDLGYVGGELIVDVNKEVKPAFLRESSTAISYSLVDPDYSGALLGEARRLDSSYVDMTLQEIGKDLKTRKIK